DLVAVARRPKPDIFAQLAHFVDAAVRRRIDFDYVHSRAGLDFCAACADSAWRDRRTSQAVQAPRHNSRDRGLARAALSAEDIAMRDPPLSDCVLERGANVLLADQLGERLRPVLAGDDLVHEGGVATKYARPRVIRGTRG